MIMATGAETSRSGKPRYKCFGQEIFGLEKPLQQIAEYFHPATQCLEERERYLNFISEARRKSDQLAQKEIQRCLLLRGVG